MSDASKQIKTVHDLPSLLTATFGNGVNIIRLPRQLKGDFNGLAARLYKAGTRSVEITKIEQIEESMEGASEGIRAAGLQVCADMRDLSKKFRPLGLKISRTPEAENNSYHTDFIQESVLCCYNIGGTQWLPDGRWLNLLGIRIPLARSYTLGVGDIFRHATELDVMRVISKGKTPTFHPLVHRSFPWKEKEGMLRMILINS